MRVLRRLPCEAQTFRMRGAYQFPFDEEVDGTMDVVSIQGRIVASSALCGLLGNRVGPS